MKAIRCAVLVVVFLSVVVLVRQGAGATSSEPAIANSMVFFSRHGLVELGPLTDIAGGDLDGDGDLDIAVASLFVGAAAWVPLKDGVPDGEVQALPGEYYYPRTVKIGDLNGDGHLDIAMLDNNNRLSWFRNDGDPRPQFTGQLLSSTLAGAYVIHIVDVDGDADMDLVTSQSNAYQLTWFENDGALAPTFTQHDVASNGVGMLDVQVVDLDGDSDLDVIGTHWNQMVWFESDGAPFPQFTVRMIGNNPDEASGIWAADLDADGDQDILMTTLIYGYVAWYENQGEALPTFKLHTIDRGLSYAHSPRVADLDMDGDLDIITSSLMFDTLDWYESDGAATPSFVRHTISDPGVRSMYGIEPMDVDGDGDLDIAVGGSKRVGEIYDALWFESIPLSTVSYLPSFWVP